MKKQTQIVLCAMLLLSEISGAQSHRLDPTWIFFRDKDPFALQSATATMLGISERAIQRRTKVFHSDRIIDQLDVPPSEAVLAQLRQTGVKIRTVSRWLNAVSVEATPQQLQQVKTMPSVAATMPVAIYKRTSPLPFSNPRPMLELSKVSKNQHLDYGPSMTQIMNINVIGLHDIGVIGTGVLIGMLDDGFNNHSTHTALKNARVIAEYDFVYHDSSTSREPWEYPGEGNHGAGTFSEIAAYDPGNMIGAAFGASFILAKTENDSGETHIEEDNYVAGLEWMERLGVDIASSSLGYKDFNPTTYSYWHRDLDGQTTIVARAASIAARKGVLLVTAMGNEGYATGSNNTFMYADTTIVSPADADSILSVGNTTSDGELNVSSGTGPTADGRIKPEVVAQGTGIYWVNGNTTDGYQSGVTGTSCSTPLVAGAAALVLSAHPELTPMQIRGALLSTAMPSNFRTSQNTVYPNNYYGYGSVNALSAAVECGPVFSNTPKIVKTTDGYTITTMLLSRYVLYKDSIFYFYRYDNISSYSQALLVPTANLNEYSTVVPLSPNDSLPRGYFSAREEIGKLPYLPTQFILFQNYPNPFNRGTTLRFDSPGESFVEVAIYNILGQRVRTVFQGRASIGVNLINFDGTDENGHVIASGVYFARFKTPSQVAVIKMLYLK